MTQLRPSLTKMRTLAGEGDFHCYRLLDSGRRLFLFTKYTLVSVSYFLGKGGRATHKTIVFVKGGNQLRHQKRVARQLQGEFGDVQLFTASPLHNEIEQHTIPRFSFLEFMQQLTFLLLMLLTGKRRYVNLYLIAFESAIARVVARGLKDIKNFICFNDQPYDVAAILYALHSRGKCRTVVIQHGLVLNEKFYFPSLAKEFWAWGELSRQHYRSRDPAAKILIKGRYSEDEKNKQEQFRVPTGDVPLRVLVAPSFLHDEAKRILLSLSSVISDEIAKKIILAIKFHPATKLPVSLRYWCKRHLPLLVEEFETMEVLAEKYDVLVTKNSTSSIDFLLRGKPVFFLSPRRDDEFPSRAYGFTIQELELLIRSSSLPDGGKNSARKKLLKIALNV